MFQVSLWGLTIVAAASLAAPVLSRVIPRIRVPAVVFELVLGILIGPAVFGWVKVDVPISVLSYFGLGFLFFVAGLETDVRRIAGPMLRLAGSGWMASLVLAIGTGYALWAVGLVASPIFVAIILASTSLGVITGIVKEHGLESTDYGQLILACASIAEFGTVMILSLFLTSQTESVSARVALVGFFVLFIVVAVVGLQRVERFPRFSALVLQLHDKTAQIRIRGSLVILLGVAALSVTLGLSPIIGAFLAGVIIRMAAPEHATAEAYQRKIEGLGFGLFIPVFFIASGLTFHLHALLGSPTALALVPVFLVALLFVRGVPTLLYGPRLGWPQSRALGLLSATSISFIVPTANLGVQMHRFSPAVGAAMIAAGLLSVILFPPAAIPTLRSIAGRRGTSAEPTATLETGTPAMPPAAPGPPVDTPGASSAGPCPAGRRRDPGPRLRARLTRDLMADQQDDGHGE